MYSDPQAQHAQHTQQTQQAQHAAGQAVHVNTYQGASPYGQAGVPYPYSPAPAPAHAGQLPITQYAYIQVPFPAANIVTTACCLSCLI